MSDINIVVHIGDRVQFVERVLDPVDVGAAGVGLGAVGVVEVGDTELREQRPSFEVLHPPVTARAMTWSVAAASRSFLSATW